MEAKPQYWRKWAISRDPKDIEDPANAPYLYEGPDGDKFIDWYNPGHKLERWAERITALASQDQEKVEEVFSQEYFNRTARKLELGPDYAKTTPDRHPRIVDLPERKSPFETDEILLALRKMKKEIDSLQRQKHLLAQAASLSGCPESGDRTCPLRSLPANRRELASCACCWLDYAEKKIVKNKNN